MNFTSYAVVSGSDHEIYEFLSEGPKGTIKKVVVYQEIQDDVYNLAFGDWDENDQRINDQTRSNNNDRDKVLATVALTVIDFMTYHPNAILFAKGGTTAKTRLYQIGIANNWNEIGQLFDIEGFYANSWEPFETGKNYQAFTLKARKKS